MRTIGKIIKTIGLAIMFFAGGYYTQGYTEMAFCTVVMSLSVIVIGKCVIGYHFMIRNEREDNSIKNRRIIEGFKNE